MHFHVSILSLLTMVPVSLVGIYTYNFGRLILRRQNLSGAIGIFLLDATIMLFPIYLLFFQERRM